MAKPRKIKQNYILLEDLPYTRKYKHISPIAFIILSLTFFFTIPPPIFWSLILIYLLYCLLPINPDDPPSSPAESEFHPSFPSETKDKDNSDDSKGLAALLGQSDGLRKLQMWARFFLPGEKKSKSPATPEIVQTPRKTLKHSMSFDGNSLLSKLSSGKLKWPSIIGSRRPPLDKSNSTDHNTNNRQLSSLLSYERRLSVSNPDLNCNYLQHQEDGDSSRSRPVNHRRLINRLQQQQHSIELSDIELAEEADDGVILINCNGSSNSSDSLVLLDSEPMTPVIAPVLSRSGSTMTVKKAKKTKEQPYQAVVNVVLIRGKHLELEGGGGDYYLKFKLGRAKCKSKLVASTVTFPYWGEEFNFHLYPPPESQLLEIYLCTLGQPSEQYLEKTAINLELLQTEQVHRLEEKFTSNFADKRSIELQLTITGGYPKRTATIPDNLGYCANYGDNCSIDSGFWDQANSEVKIEEHDLLKGVANLYDIGSLKVKVIEAANLGDSSKSQSSSSTSKLNPFCIVELMNDKFRTQTRYKTSSPRWGKTFEFTPKDILHYLEISIYTEETRERCKFLGKAVVPLTEIANGTKGWYQLKNQPFTSSVSGKLHLEFGFNYSWFKAGARAIFTKKETPLVPRPSRFNKAHFLRTAVRIKTLCFLIGDWWSFWNTIIKWQYPIRSVVGLIFSFTFFYYVEWYHSLVALLLYMLKNALMIKLKKVNEQLLKKMETIGEIMNEVTVDSTASLSSSDQSADSLSDIVEHPEEEAPENQIKALQTEPEEEEEVKPETFKERLQSIQEVGGYLLDVILTHSSIIDKFANLTSFNVPVPFQSWVMVAVLVLIIAVGFRNFILILLVNEFLKHNRGHNVVGNNEAFNVILRAPSDEELILYKGCRIKDEE